MDTLWTNYFSENEIQNIDDYIDNHHISKPGIEKTNYSDISNTNPYETNLDQFMNHWNKDHELGYLNLKLPRNIDENHLKYFFKLWSKNKGINYNEHPKEKRYSKKKINLNHIENRSNYIKYLENLKNNTEFLVGLQESTLYSVNNYTFDKEDMDSVTPKMKYAKDELKVIKPDEQMLKVDGLFFYAGKKLNIDNLKEFLYFSNNNLISFVKKNKSNKFTSDRYGPNYSIRTKKCISSDLRDPENRKNIIEKDYLLARNNLNEPNDAFEEPLPPEPPYYKIKIQAPYSEKYLLNEIDGYEFDEGSPISSIENADDSNNYTVTITTRFAHKLKTGYILYLYNTNSNPSIDGKRYKITASENNKFTFKTNEEVIFGHIVRPNLPKYSKTTKKSYLCFRENEDLFYKKDNDSRKILRENYRIENYYQNLLSHNSLFGVASNNVELTKDIKNILHMDLRFDMTGHNELYLIPLYAFVNNEINFNIIKEIIEDIYIYVFVLLDLKTHKLKYIDSLGNLKDLKIPVKSAFTKFNIERKVYPDFHEYLRTNTVYEVESNDYVIEKTPLDNTYIKKLKVTNPMVDESIPSIVNKNITRNSEKRWELKVNPNNPTNYNNYIIPLNLMYSEPDQLLINNPDNLWGDYPSNKPLYDDTTKNGTNIYTIEMVGIYYGGDIIGRASYEPPTSRPTPPGSGDTTLYINGPHPDPLIYPCVFNTTDRILPSGQLQNRCQSSTINLFKTNLSTTIITPVYHYVNETNKKSFYFIF